MKKKAHRKDPEQEPEYRDPFTAVPHLGDRVAIREDAKGLFQVRKELVPRPGFGDLVARTLRFRRDARVNLDERGTFFLKQVDGNRPLAEIEKRMRKEFDLDEEASRDATILFTKALMLRHVIALHLPPDEARNEPEDKAGNIE